MGVLGADGAAAAILKKPTLLISPADNIEGSRKALVGILGADRAAEAVLQSPNLLRSPAVTIKGAHKALVNMLSTAILKAPLVLMTSPNKIKSSSEALAEHLGKAGMLLAVDNSTTLLRSAGNKIHETAAAIKGLLGDSKGTDLLKEKYHLLQACVLQTL